MLNKFTVQWSHGDKSKPGEWTSTKENAATSKFYGEWTATSGIGKDGTTANLYGGYTEEAGTDATDNHVTVKGGTVQSYVYGGYSKSTVTGSAAKAVTGNKVSISGGTFTEDVGNNQRIAIRGGVAGNASRDVKVGDTGEGQGNVVTISGTVTGTVSGSIYGGSASGSGDVAGNRVVIDGPVAFGPDARLGLSNVVVLVDNAGQDPEVPAELVDTSLKGGTRFVDVEFALSMDGTGGTGKLVARATDVRANGDAKAVAEAQAAAAAPTSPPARA